MPSSMPTDTTTQSASSPPWIRHQILANARLLHPDKPLIDIMSGRIEISSNTFDPITGAFVPQYLCYANVYSIYDELLGAAEGVDACETGSEKGKPVMVSVRKIQVIERGRSVRGTVEDAMTVLAGVVEDRVEKIYGIGGVRGRR